MRTEKEVMTAPRSFQQTLEVMEPSEPSNKDLSETEHLLPKAIIDKLQEVRRTASALYSPPIPSGKESKEGGIH